MRSKVGINKSMSMRQHHVAKGLRRSQGTVGSALTADVDNK